LQGAASAGFSDKLLAQTSSLNDLREAWLQIAACLDLWYSSFVTLPTPIVWGFLCR